MKILYFNCASGVSGDMVVGALLDLIGNKEFLICELNQLNLNNYTATAKKVSKKKVKATQFNVILKRKEKKERNLKDVNAIINESGLSKDVKSLSKKIFLNLAKAEAKVHKTTLDNIHFHEVGAVDSIIDIVAASILICSLKIDKVFSSRVSVGRGFTRCRHGILPLPVPASAELLKDAAITVLDINKELTTPTGAAIIKTLVESFVDDPCLEGCKRGYGAGTRDLEIPNVLEIVMGEGKIEKDTKILLETNIDDMNPEFYEHVIEKLIKASAKEAFIQPIIMKKNRIGALLSVICDNKKKEEIITIIFDETTTFGIRINKVSRVKLNREVRRIKTKYGIIKCKVGKYNGETKTVAPEYQDCKRAADQKNIPIRRVYDEAKKLSQQ